jgi:hypothetical protein
LPLSFSSSLAAVEVAITTEHSTVAAVVQAVTAQMYRAKVQAVVRRQKPLSA